MALFSFLKSKSKVNYCENPIIQSLLEDIKAKKIFNYGIHKHAIYTNMTVNEYCKNGLERNFKSMGYASLEAGQVDELKKQLRKAILELPNVTHVEPYRGVYNYFKYDIQTGQSSQYPIYPYKIFYQPDDESNLKTW